MYREIKPQEGTGAPRAPLTCHCEAPTGPWQSRSTRPHRGKAIGENTTAFPRLHPKGTSSRFALRAPRPRWGLAMTNRGAFAILTAVCTGCKCIAGRGMPLPYNGVYNHREYPEICSCQWRSLSAATDAIGAYRFHGGRYESAALRREGHAPPLQWRVQSPRVPGNLQLPMAVTPRKGDAASVRRQSRQRLRSDRRYRRNRCISF